VVNNPNGPAGFRITIGVDENDLICSLVEPCSQGTELIVVMAMVVMEEWIKSLMKWYIVVY
jgi:hypothetical protein